MAEANRADLDDMLHNWMLKVHEKQDDIRQLQNELLARISPSDYPYATTCMAAILGKTGAVYMTTNNLGTTGVAVFGGTQTGDITGNVGTNNYGAPQEVIDAIDKLRQAIASSPELSDVQKQDQSLALQDIEAEANKPEAERNSSRIRLSLASVAQCVTIAKGAQGIYHLTRPFLMVHFGIDLPAL